MTEQSVGALLALRTPKRHWNLGHLLIVVTALMSVGAAVIHFAVTPAHFQEYWGFGVFFVTVGWFQILWAWAITMRPERSIFIAGAVGNALVLSTWLVSRTAGVPLGPGPGVAETARFIDLTATAFELVVVTGYLAWLVPRLRHHELGGMTLGGLAIVATAIVVVLTAWGLAAETPHGAEQDSHHCGAETTDHG